MAYTLTQVRPLLSSSELELFTQSRAEAIKAFTLSELRGLITRTRALRNKYRDLYQRQMAATQRAPARERKSAGGDNVRTQAKADVFADVLIRFESRVEKVQAKADQASRKLAARAAEADRKAKDNATKAAEAADQASVKAVDKRAKKAAQALAETQRSEKKRAKQAEKAKAAAKAATKAALKAIQKAEKKAANKADKKAQKKAEKKADKKSEKKAVQQAALPSEPTVLKPAGKKAAKPSVPLDVSGTGQTAVKKSSNRSAKPAASLTQAVARTLAQRQAAATPAPRSRMAKKGAELANAPTDITPRTKRLNPLKAEPVNQKIHAQAAARKARTQAKRDAR